MFRTAKLIHVTERIANSNDATLASLIDMIGAAHESKNGREWVAKMFLLTQASLTDTALDKLYQDTQKRELEDYKLSDYHQTNKTNKLLNVESGLIEKQLSLEELPCDVLHRMGSYLPIRTNIKLSLTCHSLFSLIQNEGYFNEKSFSHQINALELTYNDIETIVRTNANLQCYSKCQRLYLIGNCNNCNGNCYLAQLIKKIDSANLRNNNNSGINSIDNTNMYDYFCLRWFKHMLSNVNRLFIPNNWSCVFQHIPMSWIFDKNDSTNKGKNISIIGSSDGDGNLSCTVARTLSNKLCFV